MSRTTEPTTSTSKLLQRRVIGFFVGIVVGLAPLLGTLRVPFFYPLIDVYPVDLREWLIPISGLLMGMTAVVVEFADSNKTSMRKLSRAFTAACAVFVVSLIALLLLYFNTVTRVVGASTDDPPQPRTFAIVTASLEVPAQRAGSACRCQEGMPAADCVAAISLNESNVRGCFGARRVANATMLLAAVYLFLMVSAVGAVGLQLLFERRKKEAAKRSSAARTGP